MEKNYDYLDIYSDENFMYIGGIDSVDYDIEYVENLSLNDMKLKALKNSNCVCFNTLGFFKSKIYILKSSPYFKNMSDGIFIKKKYLIENNLYDKEQILNYYNAVNKIINTEITQKDLFNNIHIKNLSVILKNIGEKIEGNMICDIKPDNYVINNNIEKIKNIFNLVKNKKKICEIGVNACHSLLIMLLSNSDAEYQLFDLGYHKYTSKCLEYIKNIFPNTKINMIYGNSVNTVSDFLKNNIDENYSFDICHIDGGHTPDIFIHDYENSKKIIKNDGLIVFDDYNFYDIKNYIDNKIIQKEIMFYESENIYQTNKQAIFKFNNNNIVDCDLVSVIIPTYNRFKYLLNTIDSIKQQTYKNIEIIVVNDCSTQKEYYDYDWNSINIKIIHLQENSKQKFGQACAGYVRNKGIDISNGKYIAFCDDDDIWFSIKIELQLIEMHKNNCKMSSTEGLIGSGIYDNNNIYKKYNSEYYFDELKKIYHGTNFINNDLPNIFNLEFIKIHNTIICSSVLIEKSLLTLINNFDCVKNGYEDYNCWLKALKYTNCVYVKNVCFYYNLSHGDGQNY